MEFLRERRQSLRILASFFGRPAVHQATPKSRNRRRP